MKLYFYKGVFNCQRLIVTAAGFPVKNSYKSIIWEYFATPTQQKNSCKLLFYLIYFNYVVSIWLHKHLDNFLLEKKLAQIYVNTSQM